MEQVIQSRIPDIIAEHEQDILADWMQLLWDKADEKGRISESELKAQCREFLNTLREVTQTGNVTDPGALGYGRLRVMIEVISRSRAEQFFSPTETAKFVFSLKKPLFSRIRDAYGTDEAGIARETWTLNELIDALGLYSMDVYLHSREEIIGRQHREISELATPVVRLWRGILLLPIIGTLDSVRTQSITETLLARIVEEGAEIAIIDITGVPTVDTLTAQHLLKTISAARLMGADCIVSGIRPQIAQTMVHLGVELNVLSKATIADALAAAFRQSGRSVVSSQGHPPQ